MDNGLAIIHANRLEDLTALTVDWIKRHPLAPLAQDVFLVESNGIAQWLKLALASDQACGISAAQQFQMPARFLWQAYRTVLGADQVPGTSPFDKSRLLWRLMRLLPTLLDDDSFSPLRQFLARDDDQRKRFQLCQRLADLYDQYQVYRADWLSHWEQGHDELPAVGGAARPLQAQQWQSRLWRALRADMPEEVRDTARSRIHSRFIAALEAGTSVSRLPARIIVFGISSLPRQALEALHALSPHCQILLLVQNPSEYYWGDIVEDRELLRRQQRRHADKPELANLDTDQLANQANPLLAAWGKQGRDYISLLYGYDAPAHYQQWFQSIDLFQPPAAGNTDAVPLLQQIQQDIYTLDNAATAPEKRTLADDDHSLVFHLGHSPQREVEILHDQLLALFQAHDDLQARDIIVMVPDIQRYAPHIEAVFGAPERDDPRHIPYTISDRSQRHTQPMAAALEMLLNAPALRFTVSDILDLLDVPAIRARFDITSAEMPLLRQWIHNSGIRWGFDAGHRASLHLPPDLHHNSWLSGLQRMLLGYASGDSATWQGIEPFAEVAGLSAALAGQLAAFIETLSHHWQQLTQPGTPAQWSERIIGLIDDLMCVDDEADARLQASIIDTLEEWQHSCLQARFAEQVPITIVRATLLQSLEAGGLSQRFLAGRVNFCTLMPMRSIPFRVVCLLGMNDQDYPRTQMPMDFDLMAQRGQYRPGDRSRRDDDRYLFLEALLSARQQLYISWVGRNNRDNEHCPPSVLVAQLRDYIDQGWHADDGSALDALTCEHPLQPFSRDYFNGHRQLFTYAQEWRQALDGIRRDDNTALALPDELEVHVSPAALARLLRDPVALFFNERLKVRPLNEGETTVDDEPFALDALSRNTIAGALLDAAGSALHEGADVALAIAQQQTRLRASGQLPPAAWGELHAGALADEVMLVAGHWRDALSRWPDQAPVMEIDIALRELSHPFVIEGWLTRLRSDGTNVCQLLALTGEQGQKPWRLLGAWTQHLCACAQGTPMHTWLLAADLCQALKPLEQALARDLLNNLATAWLAGLQRPLPVAPRTAFKLLEKNNPVAAKNTYESGFQHTGEKDFASNMLLRRSFPDFDKLMAPQRDDEPELTHWARQLYAPLLESLTALDIGSAS